jgi:hypothetical protein
MTFAQRMAATAALGMAMLLGCGLLAPPAQARYIVTLLQERLNVVATGSGAIDLTGLTLFSDRAPGIRSEIVPDAGIIFTGPTFGGIASIYTGFTGSTSFGSGGESVADSGDGDSVGIDLVLGSLLFLPAGYVSGTPLSDSASYDNATFATLGVNPGTYEWTWGSGANQNFTVQIGPAAVPEPSCLALLAPPWGLAALAAARRRRRAVPSAAIS